MTAKKDEDAVTHEVGPDGSHAIGVTINGAFVPFVKLEGAYVQSLVTAYNSAEAKDARGDNDGKEG